MAPSRRVSPPCDHRLHLSGLTLCVSESYPECALLSHTKSGIFLEALQDDSFSSSATALTFSRSFFVGITNRDTETRAALSREYEVFRWKLHDVVDNGDNINGCGECCLLSALEAASVISRLIPEPADGLLLRAETWLECLVPTSAGLHHCSVLDTHRFYLDFIYPHRFCFS